MSEMVKTMNGKIDELALELYKKLDNKCAEHNPTEWESHKKVEEKVDVLISAVKENIDKHNSNNGDDFEELEEIRKRKTNLIIQGCVESKDVNIANRKKED